MPKIKTHQASVKRFKKTATGKFSQRKGGQDHFNSRESGNVTRTKRRDITTTKTLEKTLRQVMPYV